MEYKKVENVFEPEGEVEIFFKGTTYVIRIIDGKPKIVGRFRHKQQEDPYEPADGRILDERDVVMIFKQAMAIFESRREEDDNS